MSPEDNIRQTFGKIMVKFFDKFVREEFFDFARRSLEIPDGDENTEKNIARSLFWDAWQEVKYLLFQEKAPITLEEAVEFCTTYFKDPISNTNFFDIWSRILFDDHDFLTFHRQRIDLQAEELFDEAEPDQKDSLARVDDVRRAIRRAFMATARQSYSMPERLQMAFFTDLKRLKGDLVENSIPSTVDELKKLIPEEIPSLRNKQDLLSQIGMFAEAIEAIKPKPVKKGAPEPVIEIIEIDQDKAAAKAKPIELKTVVIDRDKKEPAIITEKFDITLTGIILAIKTIEYSGNSEVYLPKLQNLFFKIMEQCRDDGLMKLGTLRKAVYELKSFIERRKDKCDKSNPTDEDKKFDIIFAALGPLEANLSELMPSTFSRKDTFTIQ
jgi:hypothetical protein